MTWQHAASLAVCKDVLNLINFMNFLLQVECETVVDAGVALLRAPPSALKNFRVIGVISNVLLVVDTATEGSFVIKVLSRLLISDFTD